MYDPTIFDNLKVVLEGGFYDLEREGRIRITGREDLVDLASMARTFRMQFVLPEMSFGNTEIELSSELSDFASEMTRLRIVNAIRPGCKVRIRYRFLQWNGDESQLRSHENALYSWWSDEVQVRQSIEIVYQKAGQADDAPRHYTAEVTFLKKIDENHLEELNGMLRHTVITFEQLAERMG